MIHPTRGTVLRIAPVLLVLGLAVGALVPSAAGGQATDPGADLPTGFTDGVPVGTADGPESTAVTGEPTTDTATTDTATTSGTKASTAKYFGADPWRAIQASAAATPRSCSVSDNGLTALVVSPVFKESSGATSASTAPSPMTLSRYDEWSGVRSTSTNMNANYGLYAFRDPYTSYPRAYWHPGIGIWQYDTAGVGAPFTAIERMNVRTVSADVAKGMATRYCNPSASLIGHGAPFTAKERRNAAWAPWGYPCTLCEQEFQRMTGGSKPFANIHLVSGISVTGGAKARTCTLVGVPGTLPCWYVDPSVGTIEGATGWATVNPGGGSPTVAPAPLSEAFYVLERNGREERHWLRADTGYGIDISASRQIGKNDRPRSNQSGSGLTWVRSSGLCDLTTARGNCVPVPPSGINSTPLAVSASYRPIGLDANGDGHGDVFWYAPGSATDPLWLGQGSGAFTSMRLNIGGTYDTVRPLDVDGDGDDDILWYQSTTGSAYLWRSDGDGSFTATKLNVSTKLVPVIVDKDGNGSDEILWYGPGRAADTWWRWNGNGFTSTRTSVTGTYRPFTGDFDGNGTGDIFWYAPGSTRDALWLHSTTGAVSTPTVNVSGLYKPLVGDFDGDRKSDIFWYAPGSAGDQQWWGAAGGRFSKVGTSVTSTFLPVVADLEADGRDDILWYAPGAGRDAWWRWNATRTGSSAGFNGPGQHQPIVGAFGAAGADGIVWYAPGGTPDTVWWR